MTCVNSHIACFTRFILLMNLIKILYVIYHLHGPLKEFSMDTNYSSDYKNLGLNIAFYRKKNKLTQMQLAELLDIDRSHMSAIELANVGVSLDVIFRLCSVLNIKPKELFDFRE